MKKQTKKNVRIAQISRRLWGFNPVTRVEPNAKQYRRKPRNQKGKGANHDE